MSSNELLSKRAEKPLTETQSFNYKELEIDFKQQESKLLGEVVEVQATTTSEVVSKT